MAEQRLIIEMGMGNDLHGQDYTKAAKRAIEDAFRHSSLPLFGTVDLSHDAMRVQVTVGVQARVPWRWRPWSPRCHAGVPKCAWSRAG